MSRFFPTSVSARTKSTTQAVTTTSGNYALSTLAAGIPATLRIANTGTVGGYYALSLTAVAATTDDIYLPAGSVEYVNVPKELRSALNIGFITAAGATSFNICAGEERD